MPRALENTFIMMIARKIRAYVESPVSPSDLEHSIRYAMTITNISLSGCFIKMDQGLEVGMPVAFSLPLHGGKTLRVRGTITRELVRACETIQRMKSNSPAIG